jgi:hypothetical protein
MTEKQNPRPANVALEIDVAPWISDDSWLREDRFEDFRWAYGYASTQTHAISGLSKITPEEAYYVWASIERGMGERIGERHIP